jgi:hypothetical protein
MASALTHDSHDRRPQTEPGRHTRGAIPTQGDAPEHHSWKHEGP